MNQDAVDLIELLKQILKELIQMKQVLEKEALDLQGRDAAAVEKSTQQKEVLAQSINALTEKLTHILQTRNLPVGKKGIAKLLSTLPAEEIDSARSIWLKIVRVTQFNQHANEVNGAYVDLLSQHIARSLDIIHGQSSQDILYGRNGRGQRPSSSRKLTSA